MPTPIDYRLQATENISNIVSRIAAVTNQLDATNAKTYQRLIADLSKAATAANQAGFAVARLGADAQAAGQQARQGGLADVLGGNLAADAIKRTAGEVLQLGRDSLGAAGNIEQMRVRFTNLLGSQQAANAEIKTLQDLANNSSFTLPGLVQAETRLLGVGKSASQARDLLHAIGDEVAGVGGGAEEVNGVTTALAQMAAKGKVSTEELNQLSERGIPALAILARGLGTTTAEAQKLVETGGVAADTFIRSFQADAVDRFSGAMQRQAGTWNGLLSTASDLKTTFGATWGSGVLEKVEPIVARIVTLLQSPQVTENIRQWGSAFGDLAVQADKALQTMFPFLKGGESSAIETAAKAAREQLATAQSSATAAMTALTTYQAQTSATSATAANLERISRLQEDARSAARADIDALRARETSLERQWRLTDQIANLGKAQSRLAQDRALAGDIFSSAGQAARARLEDDAGRVAEIQTQISRDREKQGIEDSIKRRETALQTTLTGLDKEKRALEDSAAATKAYTDAVRPLATFVQGMPAKLGALLAAQAQLATAQLMAASTGGGALRDANLAAIPSAAAAAVAAAAAGPPGPQGNIGGIRFGWDTSPAGGVLGQMTGDWLMQSGGAGAIAAAQRAGAAQGGNTTINVPVQLATDVDDAVRKVTNAIRGAVGNARRR